MNISEEWMVLPGYSNYFVSNKGTVKKIRKIKGSRGFKEIILKSRSINGYKALSLVNDTGKKKTVYIHQAIANCFISKPKSTSKLIVFHKDGNKENNAVENLVWKTFSDFMKNEFETGRRSNKELWSKRVKKYGPKGTTKASKKRVNISNEKRKEIYFLYRHKRYTLKNLAKMHNCSISHIFNLLKRHENSNEIENS